MTVTLFRSAGSIRNVVALVKCGLGSKLEDSERMEQHVSHAQAELSYEKLVMSVFTCSVRKVVVRHSPPAKKFKPTRTETMRLLHSQ